MKVLAYGVREVELPIFEQVNKKSRSIFGLLFNFYKMEDLKWKF